MNWSDPRFLNDDFFDITRGFFNQAQRYFNPALISPESRNFPDKFLPSNITDVDFRPYHNDSTKSGELVRSSLAKTLSFIDQGVIDSEEITLSPTITTASLIVIRFLQEYGVEEVWLETPCYYATLFQIIGSQLQCRTIPSYVKNEFQWRIEEIDWSRKNAVWITHPRISLGLRQEKNFLLELCNKAMANDSFVIVDEATELKMPSLLSGVEFKPYNKHIIRLRGVFKPLGLNGPRIAMLLHSPYHSSEIKKWVWTYQGGLDGFSMELANRVVEHKSSYQILFEATQEEAISNWNMIRRLSQHTRVSIPEYNDGYTSALILKLSNYPLDRKKFFNIRNILVQEIEKIGVFPTLGSSMYFAYDGIHEFIRINLLSNARELNLFVGRLPSIISTLVET